MESTNPNPARVVFDTPSNAATPLLSAAGLIDDARRSLENIDDLIATHITKRDFHRSEVTRLRAERETYERIVKAATPRTRKPKATK